MGVGRPSKYKKKYCADLIEYFQKEPSVDEEVEKVTKSGDVVTVKQKVAVDFPTIAGFCSFIGINKDTFYEWIGREGEFSDAYKKAKAMQENIIVINALKGCYNPAFSAFFCKNNLGYSDKVEQQSTNYNFNANASVGTDFEKLMEIINNYKK